MSAQPVVSLTGVLAVRRGERHSLAARAIVARALGMHRAGDLVLPRFSMTEQPSAGIVCPATMPVFVRVAFWLSAAAVPWILEGIDRGETPADAALCDLGDVVQDGFGEQAESITEIVYPDKRRRWRLLHEAWKEATSFLVREWSQIEALAMRLYHGAVAASEIPQLPWKAPKKKGGK